LIANRPIKLIVTALVHGHGVCALALSSLNRRKLQSAAPFSTECSPADADINLVMAQPSITEIDQMAEWTMVAPHLRDLAQPIDATGLVAVIRRIESLAGAPAHGR